MFSFWEFIWTTSNKVEGTIVDEELTADFSRLREYSLGFFEPHSNYGESILLKSELSVNMVFPQKSDLES